MLVNVTEVVRDEGTVVLFGGTICLPDPRHGEDIVFAVDHRMARDLAAALGSGEYGEAPLAEIENWQVIK